MRHNRLFTLALAAAVAAPLALSACNRDDDQRTSQATPSSPSSMAKSDSDRSSTNRGPGGMGSQTPSGINPGAPGGSSGSGSSSDQANNQGGSNSKSGG